MIQIIDGFKLNASTPIDSRFVVADDTERTNITYLYHGLRVWQKDTNKPWFYDGTQWVSELDLVVTGLGTVDNVPKITSSSPLKIGDSQITDNGTIVNITNNLTVGTDITFSGNLNGPINANNITTGILSLNILQTGSPGQVLQMDGSTPNWVNLNTLSIGTSGSSNTVKINNTNSSGSYRLVLCDGSIGSSKQLYSNNNGIKVREASGELRILAHDGAVDRPPYSFDNSDKTGIYSPGSKQIGLSVGGSLIAKFASTFTQFYAGGSEKARFSSNLITFYDSTRFNFTNKYDRLHIYDNSSKNTSSDASLYVHQYGSQFNNKSIKTAMFESGNGEVFIAPSNVDGGYDWATKLGDSVIKAENTTGGLVLSSKQRTDNDGRHGIRIWKGKLQVGNSEDKNYSVHIKENSTDWSLVVDDTFFVKPGEIKMLRKTYERHEVLINTNDLVNPKGGWVTPSWGAVAQVGTAPTNAHMPSADFDRIITFAGKYQGGERLLRCSMFLENGENSGIFNEASGFYDSNKDSYGSATIFVPAGCRWLCYILGIKQNGHPYYQVTGNIIIQRFGL